MTTLQIDRAAKLLARRAIELCFPVERDEIIASPIFSMLYMEFKQIVEQANPPPKS